VYVKSFDCVHVGSFLVIVQHLHNVVYGAEYSCVLTTTYIVLLVLNKHNGDDSPQSYCNMFHKRKLLLFASFLAHIT
jgi:hypothetical protein